MRSLNHDLTSWGFAHDVVAFRRAMDEEYQKAAVTKQLGEWMRSREEWVIRGEVILREMEGLVFQNGMYEVLLPSELRQVWARVAHAAYTVQYMIAAVDGYLDKLVE